MLSKEQAVMPADFCAKVSCEPTRVSIRKRLENDGTPLGHYSDEALILTLWERGVSPTVVAERMAAYSNRREAENIRAKLANAQGD